MAAVRIAERRIWVGEQSRILLSGEMHFWRLDRSAWDPVLRRARELGLDIASTYVPWNFHELTAGSFDFTGESDPRRDLHAFLRLAQELQNSGLRGRSELLEIVGWRHGWAA
ncbi:MAG TPA: beta-galactosidase [Chloroflexota bacterium]